MGRKVVQVQLPQEVYRAIREFSILEGKGLDEFLIELADSYVRAKYGIEEFERITLADVIKTARGLAVVLTYLRDIYNSYRDIFGLPVPSPERAAPAQPAEEEGGGLLKALADRVEMLSKSVLELKEEIAMLREMPRGEEGRPAAAGPALAEIEEMKQEIMAMMMNAMRHMVRRAMSATMGAAVPAARGAAAAAQHAATA